MKPTKCGLFFPAIIAFTFQLGVPCRVALAAGAAPLGFGIQAKDTIFFREEGGQVRQVLHVTVSGNWEKQGTFRIEVGDKTLDLDAQKAPLDDNRCVVGIPPVTAETLVTIELRAPGGQTAKTTVKALPHRRWRVYAALKTHYDLGYTEPIDHMLDRTAGSMLDKVYSFCEATKDNSPSHRFTWNYPSWLIDQIRARKDAKGKEKFDECLANGTITWHALPITLHSYFVSVAEGRSFGSNGEATTLRLASSRSLHGELGESGSSGCPNGW